MATDSASTSVSSPQGGAALKSDTHSHSLRNQNCVRELLFGNAPLSIKEKIPDKFHESIEKCSSLEVGKKRKFKDVDGVKPLEVVDERCSVSQHEDKKSITSDQPSNQDEIENKFVYVNVSRPESPTDSTDDSCHSLSHEKTPQDGTGVVNFHNNTCLQADWSLPCFRIVENQIPGATLIDEKEKLFKQVKLEKGFQTFDAKNPTRIQVPQNSTCNGSVASSEFSGGSVASGWAQPMCPKIPVNGSTTGQQSLPHVTLANTQVLQTIQLEKNQGDIMVMPPNENHGGHFIFMQQTPYGQQLQTIQHANLGNGQLFTATPHAGHPGAVINMPHRQPVNVQLNSSGEEVENTPDGSGDKSPQRPPYPSMLQKQVEKVKQGLPIDSTFYGGDENDPSREQHNHKERIRRARIRDACHLMRQLVPGMSDKTDKATVFEFAARYVHYLRTFVGEQYDKDFLLKYSPY